MLLARKFIYRIIHLQDIVRRFTAFFCRFSAPTVVIAALLAGQAATVPLCATETLEISVAEALAYFYQNNYDIIINKYDVDKAYADFVSAKLRPNPSLSVNYNNLEISRGNTNRGDNTQLTIRVDQLIETAGKRRFRSGAAGESFEAAKLQHNDVMRNLLAGFYNLYYTVNLDKLNADFARDELARYDKLLLIANKRHSAGFLSDIDYTKLKLGIVELKNNLVNLENQMRNDIDSFNLLLGSDRIHRPKEIPVYSNFQRLVEQDLTAAGLENRFDLLSLQRQLKAADQNLALAKASRIPDVSIGGEYDSIGVPAKSGIGAGVSLNIPVFNRAQGDILKRTAERKQIEIQITQMKRKIASEIHQALNNYQTSVKVLETYDADKKEMDGLADKSRKAFALGGITVLELLDVQKTYRDFISKYHQAFTQSVLNGALIKVYTGEMK